MDSPGTQGPLSRLGIFLLIVCVLVVAGLLELAKKLPAAKAAHDAKIAAAQANAGATVKAGEAPATGSGGGSTRRADVQQVTVAELSNSIKATLAVLQDPNNHQKRQALDALRSALAAAPPKVAISAIRDFLQSGQNAETGLGFKVGEGGVLDEAPTLRTFLMDQLGSIASDAHTQDAAEVARQTLQAKDSSDEWAVAMRNLAWTDPAGSKAFLAGKFHEMLNYQAWQQNPSGGFLEAFDVGVYSGDASLVGDLAPLTQSQSPLQRAALVALERLSALSPGDVAGYLNANPNVLAERPLLRADYMGNVDLSNAGQDAQAQAYLQRADVSQAEKEKFLARLATPAGFVSNNLLTPATVPMDIYAHRAVVNRTAAAWLASGSYPALAAPLQSLIQNTAPIPGTGG